MFFALISDHSDLQVLPWLYRSEGVPGHHWRPTPGFSGWDSQWRWKWQPDHRRARWLRSRSAGEDTGPLHWHLHHHPARGQLPDLCHPHARRHPGLFRRRWRSTVVLARLPTQRAHQRAHPGPSEPAATPSRHQHRAGPSAASSPDLHSGASHCQV